MVRGLFAVCLVIGMSAAPLVAQDNIIEALEEHLSTLGYDAVLLTLRISRDWEVGDTFPRRELYDDGGFLGVDGAFRFRRDGVAERALEVREVRGSQVVAIDPAPSSF